MTAARKGTRARKAAARHRVLLTEERRLWAGGCVRVAGLDEAGAGPWAGPVVAACVVFDPETRTDALLGVDDSKKLTAERREALEVSIRASARAWAIAEASVEEIDRINIRAAGILAMQRAYEACAAMLESVDHLLIDARALDGVEVPQTALVRGDSRCLSIAAASILAKVTRDRLMTEAAVRFPPYGFERHKGYGTADHRAAIEAHGVTPLHRRTFEPIRTLLEGGPPPPPAATWSTGAGPLLGAGPRPPAPPPPPPPRVTPVPSPAPALDPAVPRVQLGLFAHADRAE